MTDDELERALFAIPLEDPPPELRGRILAATIDRPRLTFRAWEIWLVGTLVALMFWLTILVTSSTPDVGLVISTTLNRGVDLFSELPNNTLMWTALGISFVVWISQLSLPNSRRKIADR
jgi:hypothetical protein